MTVLPPPPAPKRSRVLPILITIACGLLLSLGCCFGGLRRKTWAVEDNNWNVLFGWGFITGVLVFVGGILWALVAFAVHISGSKKEQP